MVIRLFLSTCLLFLIPLVTGHTKHLLRSSENTIASLDFKSLFQDWMKGFQKEYETPKEFVKRLEIWTENHLMIERHNNRKPSPSFTMGHNQFSDLTFEEFKERNKLGSYSPGVKRSTTVKAKIARHLDKDDDDIPDEVNWIENGAVPPVKNQGTCGSCWAFSAIGAIEGAHYIDTGDLIPLSEQQLIDCDKLDFGCFGGLMDNAFLFDENSTGICSEDDYPYAGHKRWIRGCAIKRGHCVGVPHTRVSSFVDITNTAQDLMEALAKQPVSVAIEADQKSFQFYKSGVYDDENCGEQLDHGVLAVGYGTVEEGDYFLVRNSWGATWGDEGYIKMSRTSKQVNGTCGILSFASRPLLRDD